MWGDRSELLQEAETVKKGQRRREIDRKGGGVKKEKQKRGETES